MAVRLNKKRGKIKTSSMIAPSEKKKTERALKKQNKESPCAQMVAMRGLCTLCAIMRELRCKHENHYTRDPRMMDPKDIAGYRWI
jgi:hypothetical protein